jgi:hypothetical protein
MFKFDPSEEWLDKALKAVDLDFGMPDTLILSFRDLWRFKYVVGAARYSPRIKGIRRPCRLRKKPAIA